MLTLLLIATGGTVYYLFTSVPEGWTRTDAFFAKYQNADLLMMAEQLQNRVITTMGDSEPVSGRAIPPANLADTVAAVEQAESTSHIDHPEQAGDIHADPIVKADGVVGQQVIRLSINEINAWLAVKADSWLQFQGAELPPEVSSPRIWVEDGNPVLGIQITTPEIDKPLSAKFELRLVDDGHLRIQLLETYAGRLRIPHTTIASHLRKLSDKNEDSAAIDGFDQLSAGIVFDPADYMEKLENNRLTGLTFDENFLTITLVPKER